MGKPDIIILGLQPTIQLMKDLWVYGGYEWWNLGIKERAFETGMSDCRRLGIDGGYTKDQLESRRRENWSFQGQPDR